MKILIIQQKMIGDALTTSILFEALREKFPKAELHYVINSHTFPVVEHNPFIDKFLFITPEIEQNRLKFLSFSRTIQKEKYDTVIDVYGKPSSILMSAFSKAKKKIAYHKKHTSFIYSHAIKRKSTPEYAASLAVENRMLLLKPLGIDFKNIQPKIYLKKDEITSAKNYLESNGILLNQPLFMIGVLGSNPSKTYPFEYMAELIETVAQTKNAQILFNYIPTQEEEAKAVYKLCKASTQEQIHFDVFGKSLREFLAILSQCDAIIGNEGGANNMAKALNIPTFTIFSPYLNKHNWFGENEEVQNVAVHLSDYIDLQASDVKQAKKQPALYYEKFKPSFIKPKLEAFLSTFSK